MPSKKTPNRGANVIQLPIIPGAGGRIPRRAAVAVDRAALFDPDGPDDPRVQQALRIAKAFLAIEDATARTALIDLAERLAEHDGLLRR